MMSCTTFFSLFSLILCYQNVFGSPITKGVEDLHIVTVYLPSYTTVIVSLGALLLLAYFILGCVCCPNKSIKALSYQNGFPVSRLNENNFENNTEITIFPPHSTVIDLQPVSPPFPAFDDKVTFEPLPDILPKSFTSGQSAACSSRPAHFNALLKSKVSLHDWFDDPSSNFPREQLQYLKEIGLGWFGRVVEGEASQICENEEKTPIIVKILREEASPSEHLHFLHEVRPYRDLNHSNVIKLLGRCLESDPFLLIMEHSTCDLKTYLIKQEKREKFLQDGLMLQMISNIASGLRYMHDKGYCHMDLAAHNCFVCNDNSVKIGDYGVSFDQWKSDYYCLGDIALPIRWYSPEILRCSDTTIETKEITREANVWAFGVVLWEILELGKLPYEELTDEEVIQRVLFEKSFQLSTPASEVICKDEIVLIMKECWKPRRYRPSMEKIESFIIQLYNDRLSIKNKELSFEERWNSIQPRITEISSYTGTESSSLKFENDFSTRSDLFNYSSDNEILSSFEMSFDMLPKNGFGAQLSPSLNVLNGSIDELTENDAYLNSISLSCGKCTDADTLSNISDKDNFQMEDDKENFHSNNAISEQISAAIRDLDLVLANQPDSSRNSTLQKTKPEPLDTEKVKSLLVNGILKESQNLSKSSDLSNISESSFSNFSEKLDQLAREKCSDISVDSDLNGNCKFYDDVNQGHSDVDELVFGATKLENRSSDLNISQDVCVTNDLNKLPDNKDTKVEYVCAIPPPATNALTYCTDIVPEIVVHESPSINVSENLEENSEFENKYDTGKNENQQKVFRFVFKDACEQNSDEVSHQDFGNEVIEDLTESLKESFRSEPLTSTPVKSSMDSVPSCDDMENSTNKNDFSDNVFCAASTTEYNEVFNVEKVLDNNPKIIIEDMSSEHNSYSDVDLNSNTKLPDLSNADSHYQTVNSTDLDHFTTADSALYLSKSDNLANANNSETICAEEEIHMNDDLNEDTIFNSSRLTFNHKSVESSPEALHSNASDTFYISATSNISREYSNVISDVISPPKGYISSHKETSYSGSNENIENEYLEDSKASETVSPPQAFQDDGLAALDDSYSENRTSFDHDLSTSAECGSSENLDQFLDDHICQGNVSAAKLLETSFPDMESKSFVYESCADFAGNMRPRKNSSNLSLSDSEHKNSKYYESDYSADVHRQNYNLYENMKGPQQTYDQMIVEDLDTGEQTVINESYSVCDDYENSGESDEILKINTETDEAIIVDSSEALIGFVPSRSIELLQEFEVIPSLNPSYALDDEKESSDSMNIDAYNSASPSPAAMKHNSSPYESPETSHPQPYRNFCLQNEVIEEEITDEIVSPSSFHSSSSYCSNEIFIEEEKMSQSSESVHHEEMFERSVLPSMDHLYVISDDGSKTDVSSSECSPVKQNEVVNSKYKIDAENNHIDENDQEDVMHSYQPTQSVRWLSDDTLDVDLDDQSPIIIEGREILAGDIIQTCELTAEDIASALNHLEAKGHFHGVPSNHLGVSPSPSPFSSVESSPCRDAYTPDFESDDSEESNSGTSCSSTSGSFECIHNKFKHTVDMSKIADESDKSVSSREQSPMKVFSKTWDCHATPTRGVLVTPEKKFNSMRKSVSFHEEDPQVVFEYPPASDSSEDGYPCDDNNEEFPPKIDYQKYADWDLQVADIDDNEMEENIEIEEFDAEPYVRRPTYTSSSVGPLNRPMLYSLTSGFSDEDLDLSETVPPFSLNAPSNSPDEEKIPMSSSEISKLIQSHLQDLADKEAAKVVDNTASSQISEREILSAPSRSVQESVESSVAVEDIIIEELLPDCQASGESMTVHKDSKTTNILRNYSESDSDIEDDIIEEIIIEELSDGDSASDSFEFSKENKFVTIETDSAFTFEEEFISQTPAEEPLANEEDKQTHETVLTNSLPISENIYQENLNLTDEKVLDNVTHLNDSDECGNRQSDISKTLFCGEFSSHDVSSEDMLTNFQEHVNKETSSVVLTEVDKDMLVDIKLDNSDFSNIEPNLFETPVHSVSETFDNMKQSITEASNEGCHFFEDCKNLSNDEILSNSETCPQINVVSDEKEILIETSCPSSVLVSSAKTENRSNNSLSSTEETSIEKLDELKQTDSLLNEQGLNEVGFQTEVVSVADVDNNQVKTSESHMSDSSALTNNSSLVEKSFSFAENIAQNDTQLKNGSNVDGAELSDKVLGKDGVTIVQLAKNNTIEESDDTNPQVLVDTSPDSEGKETLTDSASNFDKDDASSSLHVPKIIVTPASESEIEDELEEYLREQLEHFSEASPQDFSVTSAFSCRPFDDVFGSYVSGESSDYIEAFNFEFENGNFFEDYIDDYPDDMQGTVNDRLCPDNGRQKRSSSLPLMTENLSDDDSLTMKSDSSLVYDTSKGITRL